MNKPLVIDLTRRRSALRLLASALVGGSLLVFAGVAGVADTPQITFGGCLNPGGQLTAVTVNPPVTLTCPNGQQLIIWNQQGPKGDTGAQGLPGPQGQPGTGATVVPLSTDNATCSGRGGLQVIDGSGNSASACNGKNGTRYLGEWNAARIYQPGDEVFFNSQYWVARNLTTNNPPTSVNSAFWDPFGGNPADTGCLNSDCRTSWNNQDANSVSPLPRTCPTGQGAVSNGAYQWTCAQIAAPAFFKPAGAAVPLTGTDGTYSVATLPAGSYVVATTHQLDSTTASGSFAAIPASCSTRVSNASTSQSYRVSVPQGGSVAFSTSTVVGSTVPFSISAGCSSQFPGLTGSASMVITPVSSILDP